MELGARLQADGVAFAVAAPEATAIEICLFEAEREMRRHRLERGGDGVHRGVIAGIGARARYGLRAFGPGLDPAKLLVDPYALRLDRSFALHPSLFDGSDSAAFVPKAIVTAPLPPARKLAAFGPHVVYELHVRGFSQLNPAVPEAIRGTFAGLGHPVSVAHLKRLGVTMAEMMPAAAWIDERHLPPLGLGNAWGYNPVALLAPDPRLAPGGMEEVRGAVSALHDAGIAVILDVVLNHTGEGDRWGPTLSLRGLGDATYHRLSATDPGGYANDAGCGNTLALDRPWALRLAMDALRHWATAAGLDGFRLDLATTLGRRDDGFDPRAPMLAAMRQDPVLRGLTIIAEPWDLGPGGYRLGQFAPGWLEWNDRYRDTLRRFWRGDAGMVPELATRLAGSADLFAQRDTGDSVNYVTAHDGFTLADLVAYEHRRNDANGEHGRDGTAENLSWNNGAEGPSDDPAVLARRAADTRALLATLLVSRGTPMLSMGDELGRSQGGNNNAYCQDNAIGWIDWAGADQGLIDFTARLVAIRKAHASLRAHRPLSGKVDDAGLADVAWLTLEGAPLGQSEWHDTQRRGLALVLYAEGDRTLIALNAGRVVVPLTPPPPRPGYSWTVLLDSAEPDRGVVDQVTSRSVLILVERAGGTQAGEPEQREAGQA